MRRVWKGTAEQQTVPPSFHVYCFNENGVADEGTMLLLLQLSGALVVLGQNANTAGKVVHVKSDRDLFKALKGKAGTIVLDKDVAMGRDFQQFEGSPLQIKRQARPVICVRLYILINHSYKRHIAAASKYVAGGPDICACVL